MLSIRLSVHPSVSKHQNQPEINAGRDCGLAEEIIDDMHVLLFIFQPVRTDFVSVTAASSLRTICRSPPTATHASTAAATCGSRRRPRNWTSWPPSSPPLIRCIILVTVHSMPKLEFCTRITPLAWELHFSHVRFAVKRYLCSLIVFWNFFFLSFPLPQPKTL